MSEPVGSVEAMDVEEPASSNAPLRWKTNVLLFLATVVTVFHTGVVYAGKLDEQKPGVVGFLRALPLGWGFAVPLLAILLVHEFGHFFAARYHKVEASLPYFIPMPISPFGTMGAVISMRGRIRSRDALLDIGASGPLAGLCVALPVLAYGLAHSEVGPTMSPGTQEGQSLLYLLMKRVILGPIAPGHDVFLSPMAFAGWVGIFITMLNLIPIWQLDGGHVAYALLGPKQDRIARVLHLGLLVMFALNLARFLLPVLVRHEGTDAIEQAATNALFWLFWFGILKGMMRMSGAREHPPTEPGTLSPGRKVIAIVSLVFFVLLFMPTPWSTY